MPTDTALLALLALFLAAPILRGLLRGLRRGRRAVPARSRARLPAPFEVQSPFAIDGDTLNIRTDDGDLRIRVWGIDAPEKGQPTGPAAHHRLIRLVRDRRVRVIPRDIDRYGRLVAQLEADGSDLGARMVAEGYAIAETRYTRVYTGHQRRARKTRAGLWAQGGIENPRRFRAANG